MDISKCLRRQLLDSKRNGPTFQDITVALCSGAYFDVAALSAETHARCTILRGACSLDEPAAAAFTTASAFLLFLSSDKAICSGVRMRLATFFIDFMMVTEGATECDRRRPRGAMDRGSTRTAQSGCIAWAHMFKFSGYLSNVHRMKERTHIGSHSLVHADMAHWCLGTTQLTIPPFLLSLVRCSIIVPGHQSDGTTSDVLDYIDCIAQFSASFLTSSRPGTGRVESALAAISE